MTLYLERLPNSRKYNGGIVIDKVRREYFTRFPNEYIQENIKTKFGVSRKFYITYILIDKYRSYEDYSWITVRKSLSFMVTKQQVESPRRLKKY